LSLPRCLPSGAEKMRAPVAAPAPFFAVASKPFTNLRYAFWAWLWGSKTRFRSD
jgi:hypothetical protein